MVIKTETEVKQVVGNLETKRVHFPFQTVMLIVVHIVGLVQIVTIFMLDFMDFFVILCDIRSVNSESCSKTVENHAGH